MKRAAKGGSITYESLPINMGDNLLWPDYLVIGLYLAGVLAVGLWSTFGRYRGSTKGYFLAGKNMTWIPVGASVFASNVGSMMYVGLTGTAALSGIAVTIYEWHAVFILIALGWIFMPVYIASGSFTMPEYLRKRFGGKRIRTYTAVVALLQYIVRNISGEMYCGAIFMQQILGWNLYPCVVLILAITTIYTVVGGLRAVLYTDTLQTVIFIVGSFIVFGMSMHEVGGWEQVKTKYALAATNQTLANQSFYACGMPREDAFHIFRDPVHSDIPWTGVVFGLTVLALFVWCQDQLIIQRCLSAKSLVHAKGGTLLAAGLKFLSFPMFVIPGMVARILYTEEIACADPSRCKEICDSESGCSNIAYPLLVIRILPIGVRGLLLAALLASLMSSLTSVFNSASSIVTLDLWAQFRKSPSTMELMIVGRVTVLVFVVLSILWLPILQKVQGGVFWFYMAATCAYLAVPWCAAYILGLFWKPTTEAGTFWGMTIGLIVGVTRMCLDFVSPPPFCGSGEEDKRLSITSKVDFLHFSIINMIITVIAIVIISIFTKPRTDEQLRRVTWWTRHAEEDPVLTDDEDDDYGDRIIHEAETGANEDQLAVEDEPNVRLTVSVRMRNAFIEWVCGGQSSEEKVAKEEMDIIRRKMTSIKQSPFWTNVLNVIAFGLVVAMTFLCGYYA